MAPIDPRLAGRAEVATGTAVAVLLGMATTALVLVQAWVVARIVTGAFGGSGLPAMPGAFAVLAAVLAARAAVAYGGDLVGVRVAVAGKRRLRLRLMDRAVRLGPHWVARHGTGEVTTLATRGLDGLDGYFSRYLPQLVLAALLPTAVVVVLAGVDWPSALAVGLTLPLVPVFMVLVGRHTRARTERRWDLLQRLGGHFLDVVEGLPTLAVFRRARAQVESIRRVTDQHRQATMATLRVAFLSALVLELIASLATAVVAVEVGLRLLAGDLPYQVALFVLLITPEAYVPLRQVGTEYHASREGTVAAGRVTEVLGDPVPSEVDVPGGGLTPPAETGIALRAVTLRYHGRDTPALDRVDLAIGAGDQVVLVGPSGSGKSSVLALLLGFARPTIGRVCVAGVDLSRLDLAAWRHRVAWVPQQPHLVSGTVADNVRLGRPHASAADLDAAARLAGLDRTLATAPSGWDTEVGERGHRLSTGQRQRVGLARAFLRVLGGQASLLLLDEPTVHLDAAAAGTVRRSVDLLTARYGLTVLVATHDLAWTGDSHRVVRLTAGRVEDPVPAGALAVSG